MIAAFIFVVHFLAAVYAFVKYKKDGMGEGFLAVAFVIIIFSVGWTITTMVSKLIYPSDLVASWVAQLQETRVSRMFAKELTIDTFSLVLLTVCEVIFYYLYFQSGEKNGTRNQQENGG